MPILSVELLSRSLCCSASPHSLNMDRYTNIHGHMEPKEQHNLLLAFNKNT